MNELFTIEDVREWLGCSRQANERVWVKSNFLIAMSRKAFTNCYSRFFAKKVPSSVLFSKLKITHFDFVMESEYLVWEWQAKIKEEQKNGTKDYINDIPDLPRFICYVETCVAGKLATAIENHFKVVGADTVDDKSDNIAPNPDDIKEREACLKIAEELFEFFKKWITTTNKPAMKNFMQIMLDCAADMEGGEIDFWTFLQDTTGHLLFLEKYRELTGESFNQNSYNSNVRRLRIIWREFLETKEGQKKYSELFGRYKQCYH